MKNCIVERFGILGCLVASAALAACGDSGTGGGGGAKCSGLLEGDFIITEFMANPKGTDDFKEYVEIYNPGDMPLDLNGVKLFRSKTDGSSETSKWTIKNAVLEPGQYFVMGDFDETPDPETGLVPTLYSHLNYGFPTKLGLGSSGIIGLRCGSNVIDTVTYNSVKESQASILSKDKLNAPNHADESNWCSVPKDDQYVIKDIPSYTYNDDGSIKQTYQNYGTPGVANPVCTPGDDPIVVADGKCKDASGVERDIIAPEAGKLVISEILAYAGDNVSQDDGSTKFVANKSYQYVELYSTSTFDLNGLYLSKGTARWKIESNDCITVNPDEYVVVAKSGDTSANGGLDADVVVSKLDMNQSGTISIVAVSGSEENPTETVIDSVAYTKGTANVSWQRSNDKMGVGDFATTFCASSQSYGTGMKGTPGYENTKCPEAAGDGQCIDAITGQARDIVSPAAGRLVISEIMPYAGDYDDAGKVVTVKDYQYLELYADGSFDLNGVTISKNATTGNWTIESSDCISVTTGDYVVVARTDDAQSNNNLDPDVVLAKMDLNQSGTLRLVLNRGEENEVVLDEVTYTKPELNVSWQLSSNMIGDDDASFSNFCASTSSYYFDMMGTPGEANAECSGGGLKEGQCMDDGTPRNIGEAGVGDLTITELMTNPVGENATAKKPAKWFEVRANRTVDLNGVVIKRGDKSEAVDDDECLTIPAGSYGVIAFSDDSSKNGGLPASVITYVQSKIDLTYGSTGTLSLETATGTTIASFDYPKWSDVGYSMQVSGTTTCKPTTAYGSAGNHGTPGAANDCQ